MNRWGGARREAWTAQLVTSRCCCCCCLLLYMRGDVSFSLCPSTSSSSTTSGVGTKEGRRRHSKVSRRTAAAGAPLWFLSLEGEQWRWSLLPSRSCSLLRLHPQVTCSDLRETGTRLSPPRLLVLFTLLITDWAAWVFASLRQAPNGRSSRRRSDEAFSPSVSSS